MGLDGNEDSLLIHDKAESSRFKVDLDLRFAVSRPAINVARCIRRHWETILAGRETAKRKPSRLTGGGGVT